MNREYSIVIRYYQFVPAQFLTSDRLRKVLRTLN